MNIQSEAPQQIFEFSLIYSDASDLPEDFDNTLYEAGCDDASVMTWKDFLIIYFHREAPSFRQALLSAIEAVDGTGLPVRLVRVEPL